MNTSALVNHLPSNPTTAVGQALEKAAKEFQSQFVNTDDPTDEHSIPSPLINSRRQQRSKQKMGNPDTPTAVTRRKDDAPDDLSHKERNSSGQRRPQGPMLKLTTDSNGQQTVEYPYTEATASRCDRLLNQYERQSEKKARVGVATSWGTVIGQFATALFAAASAFAITWMTIQGIKAQTKNS